MKASLNILLAMTTTLTGCMAPINLTFESARTLGKGRVDVQGNYSSYFTYEPNVGNTNYGAKIGYGVTDHYTLKVRYERLNVPQQNVFMDIQTQSFYVDYFELENKFRFKNSNTAFAIPLGYYSMGVYMLDPRMYFTIPNRYNTFEITFIPKAHIFFSGSSGRATVTPGFCVGFGLSSDLDRWALRPELGWDGYTSVGVALTVNLSPKKK